MVIYGDANGDGNIGAVDALAVVKNKLETEKFKSKEYEEAGRAKIETRQTGVVPKADDALYIIKYKLNPEQYPIDQKMIGTDEEEKIENGDNTEGTTNGTITGGEYNKENPVIPGGFETVDTEETNWDSTDGETVDDYEKGLIIQDKLGNQFVWIPVNKEEYKKQLAERNDLNITNISDLKDDTLPSRIEKEIEQIEKYGGFYVSRYEARIPESMTEAINTVSAETRNVEGTPVSKKEQIIWNYIDYNTAKKNAEKMYQTENIQSGLITGTAWDTLIKFLEGIEGKKPVESTLREWTSEKYSPYMIIRGEESGTYPSGYREKALPTQTSDDVGFRCILYVKENKLPQEITNNITITATPTTPRNTLSTGTQNGKETGSITVSINYGETSLQKQYKKETDSNWTTVTEQTINISVTENTEIYARYYDGKNSYKTTSKTIQNVDNIAPTISNCEITVNGTTIAVTAQATDKASNGAYPGTEGIVKVEYSIDGTNYQEENIFTISTAGNHTIYVKAIDKAGNETIVEKTATINQYSVNFNANGGEVNPTTKIVIPNTTYGELPIPTREGYTFTGWYTSATDGTKIESTTIVNVSELQTLYAHWIANNYILTYDLNGGSAVGGTSLSETIKTGESIVLHSNNVYRENYKLMGWSENANSTTATYQPGSTITLTKDITLYAIWKKDCLLTVKHYLENANDSGYTNQEIINTTYIKYGTEIALANYATSITNGTYHHATLAENGTNTTSITITEDTTIYLYYSRHQYTLTLNRGANIATVTGAGTYKVGKTVTIDATLATSPTGYTTSWSNWTSSNTSLIPNNSTKNVSITMPAGNVTLTANATNTINKYTVTCIDKVENASGTTLGTSTWTENYGTTVSGSSATKTYSGYTYSSCTSATVTTSGATVYRYFTQDSAGTLTSSTGKWSVHYTYSSSDIDTQANMNFSGTITKGSIITVQVEVTGNGSAGFWDGGSVISFERNGTFTHTYNNDITNGGFSAGVYTGSGGSCTLTILSIVNAAGAPYTLN